MATKTSTAIRLSGNAYLAEEVTQLVFVALAQNARPLTRRAVVSAWLHRTARNLAAKAVRQEVRRRAREEEAAVMNQLATADTESLWDALAPQLDTALGDLRETDREVVLLRFFHRRSARQIAAALGSEGAAEKRVTRALERLRRVTEAWAVRDPDSAFEWAGSLPDTSERNKALVGVLSTLSERDPKRAAALVSGLPAADDGGPVNGGHIYHNIANWPASELSGAAEWVRLPPEGPVRTMAMD